MSGAGSGAGAEYVDVKREHTINIIKRRKEERGREHTSGEAASSYKLWKKREDMRRQEKRGDNNNGINEERIKEGTNMRK